MATAPTNSIAVSSNRSWTYFKDQWQLIFESARFEYLDDNYLRSRKYDIIMQESMWEMKSCICSADYVSNRFCINANDLLLLTVKVPEPLTSRSKPSVGQNQIVSGPYILKLPLTSLIGRSVLSWLIWPCWGALLSKPEESSLFSQFSPRGLAVSKYVNEVPIRGRTHLPTKLITYWCNNRIGEFNFRFGSTKGESKYFWTSITSVLRKSGSE